MLPRAVPFKPDGWIDTTNKMYMLKEKQRDIEREAIKQSRHLPPQKTRSARDEEPVVASIFPARYLRGEVPCSKHPSAGMLCKVSW